MLPGGFTGVDVFFVLSGFLITRNTLGELSGGAFSLARFYQRRIARILPALVLVILGTLIAASFLYSGRDRAMAGAHAVASFLSYATMRSIALGNCFETSADTEPLLLCGSLSVEEQFYLLFPLILAWLYRRSPGYTLPVTMVAASASFALCVGLTAHRPTWALYILATRAWELLTGALLAHAAAAGALEQAARWRGPAALLGMVGIGAGFIWISDGAGFPGAIAALPVVSTAAVLAALVGPEASRIGAFALLRAAPSVAVGKLSYSLYLWHWPVISFVDYGCVTWTEEGRLALKVALSVVGAVASYACVETPLRRRLARPGAARRAFGFALFALALTVPWGLLVRRQNFVNASPGDLAAGGLVYNRDGAGGTVALLGDSTATMYGTGVRDACRGLDARLVSMGIAGAGAYPGGPGAGAGLWAQSLANLQALRPEVCVLSYIWTSRVQDDPAFVEKVLGAVRPHAGRLIVINMVPRRPPDGSPAMIRAGRRPPFAEEAAERAARVAAEQRLRAGLPPGALLVDAAACILGRDGEVRCLDELERPVFMDTSHLSGFGADLVAPSLPQALATALASSARSPTAPRP